MSYQIIHIENLKKIHETYLISEIKTNPDLTFQIDSINLSVNNYVVDNLYQEIILNSYFYIIINLNPEQDFMNNISQEKLTELTNKNVFCKIPTSLMDNKIENIDNIHNSTLIIFKFDWNDYFSHQLPQIKNYIIILKFNTFIEEKHIGNFFINTIHNDFSLSHEKISCQNLENKYLYNYINYYQNVSVCDIYFDSDLDNYNKENNNVDFDVKNKFVSRQQCNFNNLTRGFFIKIHKFCLDKLESVQIYFNGFSRSIPIEKKYFDLIYIKKKIPNSDYVLLLLPLDFNEKNYSLSKSFEKNKKISFSNFTARSILNETILEQKIF